TILWLDNLYQADKVRPLGGGFSIGPANKRHRRETEGCCQVLPFSRHLKNMLQAALPGLNCIHIFPPQQKQRRSAALPSSSREKKSTWYLVPATYHSRGDRRRQSLNRLLIQKMPDFRKRGKNM